MINLKEMETIYVTNKETNFLKMMNLAFIRKENPNIKIEVLNNNINDVYDNNIYYYDLEDSKYKDIDNIKIEDPSWITEEEYKECTKIIKNMYDNHLFDPCSIPSIFDKYTKLPWDKQNDEELENEYFDLALSIADKLFTIFVNRAKDIIRAKNNLNNQTGSNYDKPYVLLNNVSPIIGHLSNNTKYKWYGHPRSFNNKNDLVYFIDSIDSNFDKQELKDLYNKFSDKKFIEENELNNVINCKMIKIKIRLSFKNKEDAETFAEKYLK